MNIPAPNLKAGRRGGGEKVKMDGEMLRGEGENSFIASKHLKSFGQWWLDNADGGDGGKINEQSVYSTPFLRNILPDIYSCMLLKARQPNEWFFFLLSLRCYGWARRIMEARGGDQTRATRHTPSLSFLPYPPQKMEGEGGGMNGTGEDSRKGATGGVVSMHKTPPPFCRLLFSLTLSTLFLAVGVDHTSGNFLIVERMSINQ